MVALNEMMQKKLLALGILALRCSFNQHLQSTYCVPGPVRSTFGRNFFKPHHTLRGTFLCHTDFNRCGSRSTEKLSDFPIPRSPKEAEQGTGPEMGSPLPTSKEGRALPVQ